MNCFVGLSAVPAAPNLCPTTCIVQYEDQKQQVSKIANILRRYNYQYCDQQPLSFATAVITGGQMMYDMSSNQNPRWTAKPCVLQVFRYVYTSYSVLITFVCVCPPVLIVVLRVVRAYCSSDTSLAKACQV